MADHPPLEHGRAHHWAVASCGGEHCWHPHLVLYDREGNVIADAVINADSIDTLCNGLHEAADQIAEAHFKRRRR